MTALEVARIKKELALRCVENAQNLLTDAAEHLCSVTDLVDEWDKVGELMIEVKRFWHRLNAASPTGLDHVVRKDCKCGCATIVAAQENSAQGRN